MSSSFRDLYPENRDSSGRLLEMGKKVEALEFATTGVKVLALQQLTGPYPRTITFNVERDQSNVLILTSGTMFVLAGGLGWLNITMDGLQTGGVDTPGMFFNLSNDHKTVPLGMALMQLAYGSHTYQVAVGSGTSDAQDRAEVLILKLP